MGKLIEQSFFKGRSPNGQKTHEEISPFLAKMKMQI
jgi:hypothetical protein